MLETKVTVGDDISKDGFDVLPPMTERKAGYQHIKFNKHDGGL